MDRRRGNACAAHRSIISSQRWDACISDGSYPPLVAKPPADCAAHRYAFASSLHRSPSYAILANMPVQCNGEKLSNVRKNNNIVNGTYVFMFYYFYNIKNCNLFHDYHNIHK